MLLSQQHDSYQLHIRLFAPIEITIGALGVHGFPAGRYIYTGSAKRNLHARIQRHLRNEKPCRWHIDYLLRHPDCLVTRIQTFSLNECELNQRTIGRIVIPGFGASDCKNRCCSHLKYLDP